MKSKVLAMVIALSAMLGLSLSAGPALAASTDVAAAQSYGCVSNYEWNHFYIGSGKVYTERLFGTHGWTVWSTNYYWLKKYYACGSYYTIVKVKYSWNGSRWVVKRAIRYHN